MQINNHNMSDTKFYRRWQDCGSGNVLKAPDGTIYLFATLDRGPNLWEKIDE